MSAARIKRGIINGLGLLFGSISFLGCYPLGMAYFTAVCLEKMNPYVIYPLVMISIGFAAPLDDVIRYGIAMIITIITLEILEKQKKIVNTWLGGALAGGTLLTINLLYGLWKNQSMYFIAAGMLEGVLVLLLTVIFTEVIHGILKNRGRNKRLEETNWYNPNQERMQRFAESFQKLANLFDQLPEKKEGFGREDLDQIFQQLSDKICSKCSRCEECWKQNFFDTYRTTYEILNSIERRGRVVSEEVPLEFSEKCIHSSKFLDELLRGFQWARWNLIWSNQLMESRQVVAGQLNEMARIMNGAVLGSYGERIQEENLADQLKKKLYFLDLQVKEVSIYELEEHKIEVYITMRSRHRRCIPAREIARAIGTVLERPMIPSVDSRSFVSLEYSMMQFVEDARYQVLNGAAKVTKEGESVSGDNFSFMKGDTGEWIMSLSDGMGSGLEANKESETIIDLLEGFLEAGFCKSSIIKMLNSALTLSKGREACSTIDISSIDLYHGTCEFIKSGASATFIKRDHRVEVIPGASLPVGILQNMELEQTSRKLYHGDFVIMASDGVLEAMPGENKNKAFQDLILSQKSDNPKEFAYQLMEGVLDCCQGVVRDDMTILVTGIWKKEL